MAFHRYIGPLYAVNSLFSVLFWKTVQKYGKTTVFPGGYGRIGKIPHGQLWPDWSLEDQPN